MIAAFNKTVMQLQILVYCCVNTKKLYVYITSKHIPLFDFAEQHTWNGMILGRTQNIFLQENETLALPHHHLCHTVTPLLDMYLTLRTGQGSADLGILVPGPLTVRHPVTHPIPVDRPVAVWAHHLRLRNLSR